MDAIALICTLISATGYQILKAGNSPSVPNGAKVCILWTTSIGSSGTVTAVLTEGGGSVHLGTAEKDWGNFTWSTGAGSISLGTYMCAVWLG